MMTMMLSIIVLTSSSVFLILLLRKEPEKEKNYTLYALASMNANIWRKNIRLDDSGAMHVAWNCDKRRK